jgi:hypothetical protein
VIEVIEKNQEKGMTIGYTAEFGAEGAELLKVRCSV